MEFCIISPTVGLKRYATLSRRHLVLPQVQSDEYTKFYKERRQANDFVILDNGAYEGKSDWALTEQMIQWYNPQVCALPDYLLQPWQKTFREALKYLDLWYDKYPHTQWMYVPQAEKGDVMGFIQSLHEVLDKERRVKWIGLPRKLSTHISNDPLMRINVCKWIKRAHHVQVHALGMVEGSTVEASMLAQAGCASIDSSAPVWRGWNGFHLLSECEWPDYDCNFEATLPTAENDLLIKENLNECGIRTSS